MDRRNGIDNKEGEIGNRRGWEEGNEWRKWERWIGNGGGWWREIGSGNGIGEQRMEEDGRRKWVEGMG